MLLWVAMLTATAVSLGGARERTMVRCLNAALPADRDEAAAQADVPGDALAAEDAALSGATRVDAAPVLVGSVPLVRLPP